CVAKYPYTPIRGRELMPRLEYFIVCESSSVDAETNSVSLFHVLEDIFPGRFPDSIPNIEAVSLWNVQPDEQDTDFPANLSIRLPGRGEPVRFPMNLTKGWKRYRATIKVSGIPLLMPGELRFNVELNGEHSASHIVNVHGRPAMRPAEEVPLDADPQ